MMTAPFTVNTPYQSSQATSGRLISTSLPWEDRPLLEILRGFCDSPRVFWQSGQASIAFAGAGAAATLITDGPTRVKDIRQQAQNLFEQAQFINNHVPSAIRPRLFGGFAFDAEHQPQDIWSAFPAAFFILPRYQFTRYNGQVWLTINVLQREDTPAHDLAAHLEELRRLAANASAGATYPRKSVAVRVEPLTERAHWQQMVANAIIRIRQGHLEKVVLARASRVTTSHQIDPIQALLNLEKQYPSCHRFLIEPQPGRAFYGATPEILAELHQPNLHTVALAGSIKRGDSTEDDDALANDLLINPKERHEHRLVVQAIERHIHPLVTNLAIDPEPAVQRLHNIQHLKTAIRGRVAAGYDILDVVEALHPTPAVGGTPQADAQILITQSESLPRGWYASPVGWMDDEGDGMFAVAIRSAVSVECQALLYAGAGIVADSIPDKEWRETELKFKPMLGVLSKVR